MKKTLAVMLAVLSMVLVFSASGCHKETADVTTLTIGVDASYPPMEFSDSKGDLVGFDVDFANAIAKQLGIPTKFVKIDWDGIFQGLKTYKYDCIISSVSITPDRLKSYSFTKPYISNAQMIVVKPGDNSIKADTDLASKKVGVQVGTTANDSATTLIEKHNVKMKLSTYPTVLEPFAAMKAGSIDAVIVDEVVGQYYIKTSPKDYAAAAVKLTNEPCGICLRKDDTALRDRVQTAIDTIVANGTMKTLSEKWFGSDLTSDINTNYKTLS
ncbi:MAG: ABC transporter substrate-binding protein [Clostridia bacterium]|nr:ABC transporter substrate-binding protein [Clostridia bacterium]MDR3645821.1 ABC transporter substrate-binding protein [Clostridia bacterium]